MYTLPVQVQGLFCGEQRGSPPFHPPPPRQLAFPIFNMGLPPFNVTSLSACKIEKVGMAWGSTGLVLMYLHKCSGEKIP